MTTIKEIEEKGFIIFENVFDEQEISHLVETVSKRQ